MGIFGGVGSTQLVESFSALLEWRRSDMMARNGARFTVSKCHERQPWSSRATAGFRRHGGHQAAHRPGQGRNRAHPRASDDQKIAQEIPRARGAGAARRDLHRGRAADRAALVGADALHDASDGDVRAAPNSARPPRQLPRASPVASHILTAAARAASSHRSWFLGVLLLIFSAVVQLGAASLVMRPEHIKPSRVKPGCYALLGFVALQPFMYGQARDVDFM